MTDDDLVEELLNALDNGDPWYRMNLMAESDPQGLLSLAWELLMRLNDARRDKRIDDGRLH